MIKKIYFKERFMYKFSKFVNLCFRTVLNRFLMMLIILLFYFLIVGEINLIAIFTSSIISLIYSLSFKRVSNNFNLNLITGTLNMSVKKLDEYYKYSYIEEKDKIAKKLRKEFIEGIINASRYKKKLKMITHNWMVREVINSKEIQERFNIKIIVDPVKTKKIISEVLMLFSKEEFENNIEYGYKVASRERDICKIILKRLSIDELIENKE